MLSVASKPHTTLGVNAAFLQEVKDSNLQLWTCLRELREVKYAEDSEPIEASRVFVNLLGELRDCIALEFSLEETYGFIEGATQSLVGFGLADASTAKMQHRELYLQLHEICEQAEEAQYRGTISRDLAMFIGAFEKFDDCFRAHEDLEAELIRCGLGHKRGV
ncbi:MAG: hypothetical protein R3C53_27255 [Pirellulaceae bacterium]